MAAAAVAARRALLPRSGGSMRRLMRRAPAVTGVHAGLWLIATPVAIALTSLEAVLAATVILTALFASPLLSERAFRMLPWTRQPSSASIPAAWPERAWGPVRAVLVETEEMT